MTAELTVLDRLVAIEDLRRLQARLCRYAGTRAWDEFERLFTADGQLRAYGIDGELACFAVSPDIGSTVSARLGDGPLIVHAFCEELTVPSPVRAEGIWAVEDFVPLADGSRVVHGFGFLHQAYERHDGKWFIRSVDFIRRHVARE